MLGVDVQGGTIERITLEVRRLSLDSHAAAREGPAQPVEPRADQPSRHSVEQGNLRPSQRLPV